jgi:phosphatidylserine/phosphatidylglycerophosphate/cardiolipin synthase-like enzyme
MIDQDAIYCTWSHRTDLPDRVQTQFGDLDDFLRRLIVSSEKTLTLVAPYLSAQGLHLLTDALTACAARPVRMRLVTQLAGQIGIANRNALQSLFAQQKDTPLRHRMRVLSGSAEDFFFHAKMIVVDASRGYIGSANISARGLERNLEIGVPLSIRQARSVDELIDCLEVQGVLLEDPGNQN